jgi:hypothetical protein
MAVRDATEIIEIDRTVQVRAYSCGCHGKRMRIIFRGDGELNARHRAS